MRDVTAIDQGRSNGRESCWPTKELKCGVTLGNEIEAKLLKIYFCMSQLEYFKYINISTFEFKYGILDGKEKMTNNFGDLGGCKPGTYGLVAYASIGK